MVWSLIYSKTPKGEPLDFEEHPFLVDIYEDDSKEIVVQKAAQTGLTTYGINKSLWFADTHNISIIYTFPTSGDVSEFSRARVNPIIQSSPYLIGRTENVDAVELKQIGESFIYFRGTWSERQAISIDADMLIHDETDRSKPEVISMYRERLSHSKYKYVVHLSNPSIPEYGINALYNRSDRKKWFVKCSHCGKEQILKYPDSIKEGRIGHDEIYYRCLFCDGEITDNDRKNGKWIKTNPESKISGYHITQMMAPWISAEEIIVKRENEKWLQTFYNFVLGEPYAGENVPIKRLDLLECIQAGYEMPDSSLKGTYMGVDQGDRLHITIWRKEGDDKRLVYFGVKEDFEDLPDLMVKYRVVSCVIDAMPNKHSARRFANQFPGKVWLCYYNDNQKEKIVWKEDRDKREWRVVAHRTETLDTLADEVQSKRVVLPKLNQDLETFMRHLCALAKEKIDKPDGTYVFNYMATGEDHFAHASNYGMIALSRATAGSLAEIDNKPKERDKPITAGLLDYSF